MILQSETGGAWGGLSSSRHQKTQPVMWVSLMASSNRDQLSSVNFRASRQKKKGQIDLRDLERMMSSRYSTDFKELKELGKGGFGKVFLCENVLDQKKYALKKIPIKDGHREKVLREVVALSTMHHHHVVRYFQAWIEDGCTVELSSSEEESTSDESVKPNATLYIQMKFCPQYHSPSSGKQFLNFSLSTGKVGCDENYMRELEDKVRTLSAQLVKAEKIQSLNKMLNPLTDDTD
ncbi:hypothetical protein RHGRI_020506 [Rhododendron griersonianum]|uniref:Protein kinase domain-containing protein n=1 Tax=Rhododendron griersonianum TaxID=479676 RepID=A0AAV6JGG3_9ERIC|nr:hypothetical protein RHGRI_020506 [Rhododendron griersonianum]